MRPRRVIVPEIHHNDGQQRHRGFHRIAHPRVRRPLFRRVDEVHFRPGHGHPVHRNRQRRAHLGGVALVLRQVLFEPFRDGRLVPRRHAEPVHMRVHPEHIPHPHIQPNVRIVHRLPVKKLERPPVFGELHNPAVRQLKPDGALVPHKNAVARPGIPAVIFRQVKNLHLLVAAHRTLAKPDLRPLSNFRYQPELRLRQPGPVIPAQAGICRRRLPIPSP